MMRAVNLIIHSFMACLLSSAHAINPEPLLDYCIADLSSPYTFNGPPCKDPNLATPDDFATSALSKPGNTSVGKFGSSVILTTYQNLPGHRTQGLSMARIDIAPNGLVPPHSHPRASEVTTCLKGEILVGFVGASNNELYTQQLRAGQIHFLFNLDEKRPSWAVSGLSSENPGAQIVPLSTFTSKPPLPDVVLKKAFKIDGQEVARIRQRLEG
ncbi:hypothetical protein Cgig2_013008 [Carnegiea gigantea]|uniref:Cupin type-1 domain-containing protein n=1 Tax=Carnegiea gigantea TaxID=171969 RepID=A0A9Q1GRI8_9CARY|nr:hypothetical protein Cgig2_013008 [Carnegiea gigantea]